MKTTLLIKYKNGEIEIESYNNVNIARSHFKSLPLSEKLNIEYAYLRYFKGIRNHIKEVLVGDISKLTITEL